MSGLGVDEVGARLLPQTADLPPEVADKKIDRSSTSAGGRSQPGPGPGAPPPVAPTLAWVWSTHRFTYGGITGPEFAILKREQ